jgi:site-specific recombinase XerD
VNDLTRVGPSGPPALSDDIDAANDYAAQATAPATVRAYRSDIAAFTSWCHARGVEPLPASPGSIGRAVAAIAYFHRLAGHEPPTGTELVKRTMRGIRHALGTAPDRKAPVTADRIGAMLACIPADTLAGLRDRALLLLGFAAALRRSELIALTVADLEWVEDGLRLRIARSKTDQEGAGAVIAIPTGHKLRPCAAVRAWLAAAAITEGVVFRQVNKGGCVGSASLSGRTVADVVKRHAAAAGLDAAVFSGHSLRAGFVTSAAAAGATIFKMQAVRRHKSLDVLAGYVRDADAFKDHAGDDFL